MKRCNSFLCAVFRFATFRNDSGRRRARSQRSASPTRWTTFPHRANQPSQPDQNQRVQRNSRKVARPTDEKNRFYRLSWSLAFWLCLSRWCSHSSTAEPNKPSHREWLAGQGRAHILGLVLDWFLAFCFGSPATTTSTTAAAIHGIPLHSDSAK